MSEELKPCPLCGSTDLFLRDIAGWELDCRNCELSLVLADDPSREGLIARWNTRSPSNTEEVKVLREALGPFAVLASGYESHDGQHDYLDSDLLSENLNITVGQVRAARAALNTGEGSR